MKLNNWLKKQSWLRSAYLLFASWRALRFNVFLFFRETFLFSQAYTKQKANKNFRLAGGNLYPILHEKHYYAGLDPIYFFQDAWLARKIFQAKPKKHVDIASNLKLISILAQFVPTIFVDINRPALGFENLEYLQADIRKLPFKDNSLESLSSICVVEHIGLGRYGDEIDAFGSEKAAVELQRVLARGGNLYISLPVDGENKVYFNAHRAFAREYALRLFSGLELKEERYLYGSNLGEHYKPELGFGTGFFHFHKA